MNSNEYRKRIEKSLILQMYLDDIVTYTNDTLNYLKSDNKEDYYEEEIIAYLASIPETIESIKNIVYEMEMKLNELQ